MRSDRRTITIGGVAGPALLLGIFVVPHLIAAPLDAERAKQEIRADLKRQVSQQDMVDLQAAGLKVPERIR